MDEEIEQRANMLANRNQYETIGPTPEEIERRTAAALADLSPDDVDRVRRRCHEITRARLMSRL